LLVAGQPSYGESLLFGNPGLSGLDKIFFLFEPPNKNSEACGITRELIRESFMYPASSARFKIVENWDATAFYIQLTGVRTDGGACVRAINVEVYKEQDVKLPYQKMPTQEHVQIWKDGAVLVSNVSQHPQFVREKIEEITKEFITAWNLANKDKH
jgi:hypothetical protein